ncbi:MAG: deoxyribose-phosphate aldolase [Myxococcales bacterium]|nr:deoxyribose-phosphate aldolase [Myxococcales bacterium]
MKELTMENDDDGRLRRAIELTLLAPAARRAQLDALCAAAAEHRFHGVCVNPVHVTHCRRLLGHGGPRLVTVVGFPLGENRSEVKSREAMLALEDGADELDMVMALGDAREGRWDRVQQDIAAVVAVCGRAPVKVILETCLLDNAEKRRACQVARDAGAKFVKTSTGFASGGATVADVALMREVVGDALGVKASGGIRSRAFALQLLAAGASRLGTSSGIALLSC